MNKTYAVEMRQLAAGLIDLGIPFVVRYFSGGVQIIVKDEERGLVWDAICHDGSYGHQYGLIEVMGDIVDPEIEDDVEGYLRAKDILERLG